MRTVRKTSQLGAHALIAACLLAAPCVFQATDASAEPQARLQDANRDILGAKAVIGDVRAAKNSTATGHRDLTAKRLGDGALLLGAKDYDRAIMLFNQVILDQPTAETSQAIARDLLAEAYFLSEQYLAAKRVFTEIFDRGGEASFRRFRERAAVRLVDITLRLKDLDQLDALFVRLSAVTGAADGINYAKGKGLLAQDKLAEAQSALSAVSPTSVFGWQAKYLLGVVATRNAAPEKPTNDSEFAVPPTVAALAPAANLFQQVTTAKVTTSEDAHIVDMAWLALGRIHYATSQLPKAIAAYNHIKRKSPEFGTMLYELAWVYVRLGDVVRAQRALEVLNVADPEHNDVADASLLRADLMLRAGKFERSRRVYVSVRGTYEGMRDRVQKFLGTHDDPGVYFDSLTRDQIEVLEGGGVTLPELAIRWARDGKDGEQAFAVIDDAARSRKLIRESNEMINKLNAVLNSPNRIRVMPELAVGLEKGLGGLNKIAMARMTLGRGLEEVSDSLSAELRAARNERKKLERRVDELPVTKADFGARDQTGGHQWDRVSQLLHEVELEIDRLQASINGLDRVVKDSSQAGIVRHPERLGELKTQLAAERANIEKYRAEGQLLRKGIEAGRLQVGLGDARFAEDAAIRKQYRELLWREVKLSQAGGGGNALAAYAGRVAGTMTDADAAERELQAAVDAINAAVESKANEFRVILRRETGNVVDYEARLGTLDGEARTVVGGVAKRNFQMVRRRLHEIVMRADVGLTEEAWEVREEQLRRVRRLKVERARNEQRLDEELEEVLEDSNGGAE